MQGLLEALRGEGGGCRLSRVWRPRMPLMLGVEGLVLVEVVNRHFFGLCLLVFSYA